MSADSLLFMAQLLLIEKAAYLISW
jgi:hypothetical protein